ncbi:hypothetical protein BU15DRAFT_64492 [Melanogaster broomeanus]|nr:hypothetical protein BU15DRAFT_64492 [Melanogaster broomeanus]
MSNCSSESWVDNQLGQNSCVTAEIVGQLCNATLLMNVYLTTNGIRPETDTVSVTNFQESQYIPTLTTANACTWYFPSGYTLPGSESIPYWSGTNPATWPNQVFNPADASTMGGNGSYFRLDPLTVSDFLHLSQTRSHGRTHSHIDRYYEFILFANPGGSNCGGVIGGIVILLIIGGFFCVKAIRRRRQRESKDPFGGPATATLTTHPRGPNGTVQPVPYAHQQTPTTTGPTSHRPYMSSHDHSAASLAISFLASPTRQGPTTAGPVTVDTTTDVISPFPFIAASSSRTQEQIARTPTGKAAEARAERVLSPPGQRARLNPPPYSPTATASSGGENPSRRLSLKQAFKRKLSTSGSAHSAASASTRGRPSARAEDGIGGEHGQRCQCGEFRGFLGYRISSLVRSMKDSMEGDADDHCIGHLEDVPVRVQMFALHWTETRRERQKPKMPDSK